MGYELYITRQENWFDQEPKNFIPLEEWIDYVSNDPEMRLDNFAQIESASGEVLRIEEEGIGVWEKYSHKGDGQNHAWFTYYDGNIIVKNPDQEIINKMVDIGDSLNARVQGDGGELYQKQDYLDRNLKAVFIGNKMSGKPWWKFW